MQIHAAAGATKPATLETGLVFAKFSRPTARVLFSHAAIVTTRDGVPSFMFRMANERGNQIVEATVQGRAASASIAAALTQLDADADVDVIVLARGGGSPEDLLPFSDEVVCRAVAGCATPVVAAIGFGGGWCVRS